MKENKNLGGKCYENQIALDLLQEPKEICDPVMRRRYCDSFYICENKRLKKELEAAKKLLEFYKNLKEGKSDERNK